MTTSFRDVELLSAYLDGQLNPAEVARLESRLTSDKELSAVLDDIRSARNLLRHLPLRRAPRNFMLTPQMAGIKPPVPRSYSALRFATVLATLLFIISVAINGLIPVASSRLAAAPAPAYGVGGYGGGAAQSVPQEAPAATQAPAQPFVQSAPMETQTPSAALSLAPAASATQAPLSQDNTRIQGTPSTEFLPKAQATQPAIHQPPRAKSEAPVPLMWVIALGALAVICGMGAWSLRMGSERKFRSQWNKK